MISKEKLEDLIRREVWAAAAQTLKKEKSAASKRAPADFPPKMEEREMDNLLFNGGYEDFGFHKTIGLNESQDAQLQVTNSEIQEFEKNFSEILSKYPNTTVSFDEQGKQNKSMMFRQGAKGVHVQSSGYIQVGNEGTLRWMFSIPNGFRVETEGIEINQVNRDIFADLFNFYNDWQQRWRMRLTGNIQNDIEDAEMTQEQPGGSPGLNFNPGGAPNVAGDSSMGIGADSVPAGPISAGPSL